MSPKNKDRDNNNEVKILNSIRYRKIYQVLHKTK